MSFKRDFRVSMGRFAVIAVLSIAGTARAVNAPSQNLSSVNKDKNDSAEALKDSPGEEKSGVTELSRVVLHDGKSARFPEHLAAAVGFPAGASDKDVAVNGKVGRLCSVAYEPEGSARAVPKPLGVYLRTLSKTGRELHGYVFRVGLDGKLEKALRAEGKYDADGKLVSGSGAYLPCDVDSKETRLAFDAEMAFWLKDWLRKRTPAGNAP